MSIAWAVKEGPLYVVKDVNVKGAETTNAGLVQNAVTLMPGAVMSQGAIDTTRRNLYDIGSFRRVDFDFGDSTLAPDAGQLPQTSKNEFGWPFHELDRRVSQKSVYGRFLMAQNGGVSGILLHSETNRPRG